MANPQGKKIKVNQSALRVGRPLPPVMSINKFQFSDVEYARIKGVEIIHVNWEKFCYPACANDLSGGRQCNKKVIEIESGVWRCERCDMSTIEPTYRYTLWCVIFD